MTLQKGVQLAGQQLLRGSVNHAAVKVQCMHGKHQPLLFKYIKLQITCVTKTKKELF